MPHPRCPPPRHTLTRPDSPTPRRMARNSSSRMGTRRRGLDSVRRSGSMIRSLLLRMSSRLPFLPSFGVLIVSRGQVCRGFCWVCRVERYNDPSVCAVQRCRRWVRWDLGFDEDAGLVCTLAGHPPYQFLISLQAIPFTCFLWRPGWHWCSRSYGSWYVPPSPLVTFHY